MSVPEGRGGAYDWLHLHVGSPWVELLGQELCEPVEVGTGGERGGWRERERGGEGCTTVSLKQFSAERDAGGKFWAFGPGWCSPHILRQRHTQRGRGRPNHTFFLP